MSERDHTNELAGVAASLLSGKSPTEITDEDLIASVRRARDILTICELGDPEAGRRARQLKLKLRGLPVDDPEPETPLEIYVARRMARFRELSDARLTMALDDFLHQVYFARVADLSVSTRSRQWQRDKFEDHLAEWCKPAPPHAGMDKLDREGVAARHAEKILSELRPTGKPTAPEKSSK